MHVVFVEPGFPRNQREFVRALKQAGARVTGIGESAASALDPELMSWLMHYEQVGSVVDEGQLQQKVRWIQERMPVHRLEATVEAHVMAAAHVREATGIPGTSTQTAFLCRDKPAMKQVLREGGVPCARSIGSGSLEEVYDFADEVGYPLIVKPRAAAGASGTHRVETEAELAEALQAARIDQGGTVAVEEFVEGHEGFYDTITIGGSIAHEFVSHYYPNVLDAMRTRWISPQIVTSNEVESAPAYQELLEMGRRVSHLLGVETSATHMEWFFGPKGLRFSEIACRPPGVGLWDLYAAANDIDIYYEWALAVTRGVTSRRPSRRFATGMIALRPDRDGTISSYEGLSDIERRYGEWILDAHLPPAGTATQPVSAGYMANAWIRMKHTDFNELRRMLDDVGETIQVRAT